MHFFYLKTDFVSTNRADPDEMPHYAKVYGVCGPERVKVFDGFLAQFCSFDIYEVYFWLSSKGDHDDIFSI